MKNRGYTYPDLASAADEGVPVAAFYASRYPHSSEREWRGKIAAGQVRLDGEVVPADRPLKRGDRLTYFREPWEEPDAPARFEVLLEDEDVAALAKPSGLPVLPGGMFLERTLLYLARARFGPSCSPLHRLGRGTSGAILFTRNAESARRLTAAMKGRRIRKVYLALASGTSMPDAFTVDAPIGPVPYRPTRSLHAAHPEGRASVSLVRVIRRLPERDASLVEVTIPTGRPHQIRIHLAHAGFPLVGDPLYGAGGRPKPELGERAGEGEGGEGAARPGETGYLLHSWKIRFPHPSRGEDVEVVCPPPAALDPDRRNERDQPGG